LSIIDLNTGHQPLFNEDGSIAIVFNGEIYNYQDLQKELESKGHRFRTKTDTECIVHGYEEWGSGVVDRLRGMFAFAVWDEYRKELFLARDRLGIKPLYYYWDGQKLIFASEIKAILEVPAVPNELNLEAIDDYLTYLYIPAPKTIFRNIFKLLPGHHLTVSHASVREVEYWDISFASEEHGSASQFQEGLLEKLREAVRIRLVSDVPLGAFLSGGIDSSAVVGVMSELMSEPVNTASIGFRESRFDELPYARAVARKFNTAQHEKIVEADAAKILQDLVWHFDEPFADSSMVPTYYVSQVAREIVTVCLSGDGGDENFAGYRRYKFDLLENRIRSLLPQGFRRPLFGTLGTLFPKADWLPRFLRGKTLLTNLSLSPEAGYYHTMSWFTPGMKTRLYRGNMRRQLSGYDSFSVMERYFEKSQGWHPLSRIQYVDMKTYLVDDILTKVDRASMAHSLEVRVPLLDHQFMEYAARIPADMKLYKGEGKYLFKHALESIVPKDILYRPKMGFSIPLSRWLRGELKQVFEETVLADGAFISSLLDQRVISGWWKQHQRGTRDFAPHLWALLVLENWGKKFITREPVEVIRQPAQAI
jgi:asparagine synthase (glutamine-hydrolysing)